MLVYQRVMTLCNKCQPQIIIHHWAVKKTGFGAISETHFFGVPPQSQKSPRVCSSGIDIVEDIN